MILESVGRCCFKKGRVLGFLAKIFVCLGCLSAFNMKYLIEIVSKDIKCIFECCFLNKLSLNFEKIKKRKYKFKENTDQAKTFSLIYISCK